MKQVKGMIRTMLATAAFMLFGFAVSTSAVAQDIPEPAPQDIPEPAPEQTAPEPQPAPAAPSGAGVDQLIGAIQDVDAQAAALGGLTDLAVDQVQLVGVQNLLTSQDDANAVNEVLTANGEKVMALQEALAANQVIQEALGENVSTQDVLAVDVLDDGGIVIFHQ